MSYNFWPAPQPEHPLSFAGGITSYDRWTSIIFGGLPLLATVLLLAVILTTKPWVHVIKFWNARPNRGDTPGRRGRSYALGDAFGMVWPDAPDEIVSWVARLSDENFTAVYDRLLLMVDGYDASGSPIDPNAVAPSAPRGILPADIADSMRGMSAADFRKLLTVMERA